MNNLITIVFEGNTFNFSHDVATKQWHIRNVNNNTYLGHAKEIEKKFVLVHADEENKLSDAVYFRFLAKYYAQTRQHYLRNLYETLSNQTS